MLADLEIIINWSFSKLIPFLADQRGKREREGGRDQRSRSRYFTFDTLIITLRVPSIAGHNVWQVKKITILRTEESVQRAFSCPCLSPPCFVVIDLIALGTKLYHSQRIALEVRT